MCLVFAWLNDVWLAFGEQSTYIIVYCLFCIVMRIMVHLVMATPPKICTIPFLIVHLLIKT